MKNKKCIDNKKLYELESNITNSDIFLYENYFPVFPYDIYIKFGGTKKGIAFLFVYIYEISKKK